MFQADAAAFKAGCLHSLRTPLRRKDGKNTKKRAEGVCAPTPSLDIQIEFANYQILITKY
jgi:hypothetical protein